ncbi:hypothetical protein B0187_04600 [Haemophilus paracuniculus]|uniref:ACP-like domain-containing protein n=1 Tax=Haemophilus paracuniculus TaxID=734 RepID=A0A1T0ASW7_9PAST|nr:hypothetical protein [Haemophilus paracuniculus]OOR99596.1 hypothetical protein B0187_04600 [Haemophilus paracuniculus]
MKLVKLLSAIAVATALSACSTASDVASSATNAVSNAASSVANGVSNVATGVADGVSNTVTKVKDTAAGKVETTTTKLDTTSKTVVYSCQQKKSVTATYAFENGQVKAVNLKLGKQAINGLMLDANSSDVVSFASKGYRWNVDTDFSLENAEKTTAIHLAKIGKQSDQLLAKLCEVNKSATARYNK